MFIYLFNYVSSTMLNYGTELRVVEIVFVIYDDLNICIFMD